MVARSKGERRYGGGGGEKLKANKKRGRGGNSRGVEILGGEFSQNGFPHFLCACLFDVCVRVRVCVTG